MHLTCRLLPYPQESLYSYLCRMAIENKTRFLGLWNCCKKSSCPPNKRIDVYALFFDPFNYIDLEVLCDITKLKASDILQMTFVNLLRKFSYQFSQPRTKYLSEIIRNDYFFCVRCLQEHPYHSLFWSIKGVETCLIHRTYLHNRCHHCKSIINLKDVQDFVTCPYCQGKLADGQYNTVCKTDKQEWLFNNFVFLTYDNTSFPSNIELTVKFLFILNRFGLKYNTQTVSDSLGPDSSKLPMLLSIIRDCKSDGKLLNIAFVLRALDSNHSSMEQLFNIKAPDSFHKSIVEKHTPMVNTLSCLAPWCKSHNLVKTGTTFNWKENGELNKYYLGCYDCGCQYALDGQGSLIERTHYIRMYPYIKNFQTEPVSLKELSSISGFSFSELVRGIAYFDSRNLIYLRHYHIEVDGERLSDFVDAVKEGEFIHSIRQWESWRSKYEYFYYRYHADVLRAELTKPKPNKEPVCLYNEDINSEYIDLALNSMKKDGTKISVKSVAQKIWLSQNSPGEWLVLDRLLNQ